MSNYQHKPIRTIEDADRALLFLGKEESFLAKKDADMNSKIQQIKDKYDIDTASSRAVKELIEKELASFLNSNKQEFQDKRTKQLVHGTIGFRYGTPTVLLLSKKFTMKTALEFAKKLFGEKYVRSKEELAKDAIIADYSKGEITDDKLAGIGLRIDKNEKEVIEINWESIQN